ncbi:protein-arginine deiminase family protein [Nonomuraea typhae]|uniref:protein-arginine deiminase family protein n=1 Tax=Nonomuraea typhae TaxID=2603600 RepID=UPI0012F70A08|nr:protein-arginine deiminase family protein [Nonomuraea typhae]
MSTLPPDKATLHVDFTQVGEVPATYETWGRRGDPPGVLVMPGLRAEQVVPGLARLKIRRPSGVDRGLVLRLEPRPKDVSIMTKTAQGWEATADPAADTTLVVEAAAYVAAESTFRAVLAERDGSGPGDSALFSVAPFLLLPNDCPVEKIYVWYHRELNHPTVAELVEVLREVLGPDRVDLDPLKQPIAPGDYKALEVIDGSNVPDSAFVQDYCEIGYRWIGGGRSQHLAVVTPNEGKLSAQVRRAMSSVHLGVLEVTDQSLEDSTDFGGNVECFPAVGKKTGPMPSGPAGPEITEHPPAPHGKILLGESEVYLFTLPKDRAADLDREDLKQLRRDFSAKLVQLGEAQIRREGAGRWLVTALWKIHFRRQFLITETATGLDVFFVRTVEAGYRRFLAAQGLQPILSVDTSWLSVGHVDEIISVVPGRRLLVASSGLAVELLSDVRERKFPATRMFRGRKVNAQTAYYANGLTVDQALDDHGSFNAEIIQPDYLNPIEERLKAGLDLQDEALIRLPVLYESVTLLPGRRLGPILDPTDLTRTTALSTSLVNVLVVGEHILMPRPYGPRLSPADVETIIDFRPPDHLLNQWHWEKAGTTVDALAERFEVAPDALLKENPDAFVNRTTRGPWTRIRIPEQKVDLFEAYVEREFRKAELAVRFVDTWIYHQFFGELHCATNVRRTPPDTTPAGWGKLS